MKINKIIKYYYWSFKFKSLINDINPNYFENDFENKNKIHRLILWYMASKKLKYSDSIDYAFYKVFHLWGTDSLTNYEKRKFL